MQVVVGKGGGVPAAHERIIRFVFPHRSPNAVTTRPALAWSQARPPSIAIAPTIQILIIQKAFTFRTCCIARKRGCEPPMPGSL